MTPSVVPTGAISPAGQPAAAGGVDVSGALTSVVPGIRKLKQMALQQPIPNVGGRVQIDLPRSSYMQRATIRITGEIQIKQGAEEVAISKTDPRTFLDRLEFALSGSTNPRVLTGVQQDIVDELDTPAITVNKQTYKVETKGKETTTKFPFVLTFSPIFCVAPQNLYGIPYLGADGTVPQLNFTFANPDGTLAGKAKAGPTITLEGGLVEVELYRIDLPGPVAPREVIQNIDGHQQVQRIPGQGLYQEASYILLTRQFDAEDLSSSGTDKLFRLPIGPDYLRIIVLAYKEGALDDETSPLLDRAELVIQQATTIESKKIWQFDREYARTYNKGRPTGVYVFSGIDETGTDSDIYVSRDLGNFDVHVFGSANAVPANSRFAVITQELLPLSTPGLYL